MISMFIQLLEKNPTMAMVVATLLVGGSGAGVGAFATKGVVDLKHEEAMSRIRQVEISAVDAKESASIENQRLYEAVTRIENKLDNYILRGRLKY